MFPVEPKDPEKNERGFTMLVTFGAWTLAITLIGWAVTMFKAVYNG